MLTGHADFNYAKDSCRHGAFDYLLKPLEEEELLDTLERFKEKYNVMNDLEKENITDKKNTFPQPKSDTLKLFIKYINDNYHKTINLYEIAETFHFNPSYISQLFKRELQMSFSEYVTMVRMDIAEKLLGESDTPVKSIHTEVGINDYYYFIKLFKKHKGVTPYQMRQKNPFDY